ncbi:hypothetical protein H257_10143 [Aphanomyces astaci]|uniref:SWIM-type domain-containing protein n=1 Tax=Aphanomyces astaci TaxID=112090 RepID=W4G9Z5_APHAT|nr:hypothetical protein H257_10143 [Aphanomyces astaci]ETV75773.1 hypothetical protein H257_10143 [Aphanomyces astaci]|eukprot:XP_009834904.1 hypothetical protein H257_10143 [Aphanomyces astaci]
MNAQWKVFATKSDQGDLNDVYDTSVLRWTCTCPSYAYGEFLLCKHLVPPRYKVRQLTPPMWVFPTTKDEMLRQECTKKSSDKEVNALSARPELNHDTVSILDESQLLVSAHVAQTIHELSSWLIQHASDIQHAPRQLAKVQKLLHPIQAYRKSGMVHKELTDIPTTLLDKGVQHENDSNIIRDIMFTHQVKTEDCVERSKCGDEWSTMPVRRVMGSGPRLTIEEQVAARTFRLQNSYRAIAKHLGRSKETVRAYLIAPDSYDTSQKGRKATKIVHQETCHRRLLASGFFKYKRRKHMPLLKEAHKVARVKYATDHLVNPPYWTEVIWSDEKNFNLDGLDDFQYYWEDLRKKPVTFFVRASGGGGVMFYAFSGAGVADLAILEGRQVSEKYIDTSANYLFPCAHSHYGLNLFFCKTMRPSTAPRQLRNFWIATT